MGDDHLLITPQTRVADLLKAFPQLEDVLVEIAPAFKKLRNPVLRKTVAKVTSLAQAARVGNVSVIELVRRLRREVNQPDYEEEAPSDERFPEQAPDWFDPGRIVQSLDARPMIDTGEQPIGRVLHDLGSLNDQEIYELITPFEPAPLIDKARERRFRVWSRREGGTEFHTFFCKN